MFSSEKHKKMIKNFWFWILTEFVYGDSSVVLEKEKNRIVASLWNKLKTWYYKKDMIDGKKKVSKHLSVQWDLDSIETIILKRTTQCFFYYLTEIEFESMVIEGQDKSKFVFYHNKEPLQQLLRNI